MKAALHGEPPALQPLLERLATNRTASYFSRDIANAWQRLSASVRGRRVLVIGGAGSIGSATIEAMLPLEPKCVHVLDINENGLAELVRRLRNCSFGVGATEIRTLVLDFGHPICRLFLESQASYDLILNFAAIKHVRAERDPYSMMTMLETNIVKQARFMGWLAERSADCRYFAVSTDKAADPVSVMGATKRLMEEVVFSIVLDAASRIARTSARFANVACSDGSLLQSFIHRLERGEAIACPAQTARYFVSHEEAAHICLIAALLLPTDTICVPKLDPRAHLVLLEDLAHRFLCEMGFRPVTCHSEDEARFLSKQVGATGGYPLLLTPRDTSGEKPYEVFVGRDETSLEIGFDTLLGVKGPRIAGAALNAALSSFEQFCSGYAEPDKSRIVDLIRATVPSFAHLETGQTLDERM